MTARPHRTPGPSWPCSDLASPVCSVLKHGPSPVPCCWSAQADLIPKLLSDTGKMSPTEVDRDEEDLEHGTEGMEVEESIGQERGHAPPEGLVQTGPEPESYPSFVQEESQK